MHKFTIMSSGNKILDAVESGTINDLQEAIQDAGADATKQIQRLNETRYDSFLHVACNYNVNHPEVAIYLMEEYLNFFQTRPMTKGKPR